MINLRVISSLSSYISDSSVRFDKEPKNFAVKEVTVNEQNPQAIGFYEHLGFVTYKRTELDEECQPYPLLYMKLVPNHENERHFS